MNAYRKSKRAVACLALFATLGGGAYAAATTTGPSGTDGWEVVQSQSSLVSAGIACPEGKKVLRSGGSATPSADVDSYKTHRYTIKVGAWAVCAQPN